MNDETKEVLIDLIDYYNTMGTESDPGIHTFEHVVQRASKALERHARNNSEDNKNKSANVDPFAFPVDDVEPIMKPEGEW